MLSATMLSVMIEKCSIQEAKIPSLFGKGVNLVAVLYVIYIKLSHTTGFLVGVGISLYQPMRSGLPTRLVCSIRVRLKENLAHGI